VVDALRQNDPASKKIVIRLRDVTSIDVDLEHVQLADWGGFLRVIATRENLVEVTLREALTAEDRSAPPALVSAMLRSIRQNSAIRTVHLIGLHLPTDIISTFVDTASSITDLPLLKCDIMAPSGEREQGVRDLAAALQRNTTIQDLGLLGSLDTVCLSSILQELRSNISLKTLRIDDAEFSATTAQSVKQLLESTTSIETFDLAYRTFGGGEYSPIAQGIINSRSATASKFEFCDFNNDEFRALFRSVLRNKRNLTGLWLDNCDYSRGPVRTTNIISAMLRPNSQLRSLALMTLRLYRTLLEGQLQSLLRAVEKSKLERFKIGDIQSQQQLLTLTESIPLMRIKVLQLDIDIRDEKEERNCKADLLRAVKNNFSLRAVLSYNHSGFDHDVFDADDEKKLFFYTGRNKRLDQWVDNQEQVDGRKVWPEALKLAEQAGPDSLLSGLRSVLKSDYVTLPAERNCKCP